MRIGYACLALGVPGSGMRSIIMKNATPEKLREVIGHNLYALEHLIDYNIENGIRLFRISSDLIPFGSSPVNGLAWWEEFEGRFQAIGKKILDSGMRISMHPGQYTVLNSPDEGVVTRAVEDLVYHARVLDSLGTGSDHKIILHVGGVYNERENALERFRTGYRSLPHSIRRRLVIENDDRSYDIQEVLELGTELGIPVVFDNLHHAILNKDNSRSDSYWIEASRGTWEEADGHQKIHYSQQNTEKRTGSHSDSIRIEAFMAFHESLGREDLDIMLEVKDKNLSAVKCINCTAKDRSIRSLEREWSRYKYRVLEGSHADYLAIRALLKDKADYPAILFYTLVEHALEKEPDPGGRVNAAQHVWGYFKNKATQVEKNAFAKHLEGFMAGRTTIAPLKRFLWKLTEKYEECYLMDSYYFIIE